MVRSAVRRVSNHEARIEQQMAAYGLYTQIRANRRRSILLLIGLFFLVYLLVFAGALDRSLRAYDAANGKVLWETRLNDVSSAVPISYAVNGKQYIAIVAGRGGFHYASYAPLVPELTPPPDRGSSLWVFELP